MQQIMVLVILLVCIWDIWQQVALVFVSASKVSDGLDTIMQSLVSGKSLDQSTIAE